MYTYVIIDDEPLIRRGTKKKLEPLSHLLTCCGEASDGREGLELVRQLKPDIVILDMQMPVMDGTELLPALSEEFPSTALIVISGFQNFDYMKQAISSKVIDYILKPFSKDEIQQTVLKTIDSLKDKEAEDHHLTSMVQEKEEAFYSLDLKLLTDFLLGYTDTAHSSVSSQKLSFINEMHHFVLLTLYSLPEQDPLPVQNWLVRFMDCMAMQAIVPMRVAISADKIASASVFHKACMICSFRNKAAYHLVVKPPHFARVLLALKESTIKVIMGAYKKIKISPRYIFCAVVLIIMCSPPLLYP